MSVQDRLELAGTEFLKSTDAEYDTCASGIFTLDRIIVGTPTMLTAEARGYFVPILYAYWERFFRICFNEFLRCVAITRFQVDELRLKIAVLRIGRELTDLSEKHKLGQLHDLCHNRSVAEIKGLLRQLLHTIESPAEFSSPHHLVRTYSNVEFTTLEDNCLRFGLDLNSLKANFAIKSLYSSLKELVDMRNDIAHGSEFKTLTSDEWEEIRNFVLKLMQVVQIELYESLKDRTKILEHPPLDVDYSNLKFS